MCRPPEPRGTGGRKNTDSESAHWTGPVYLVPPPGEWTGLTSTLKDKEDDSRCGKGMGRVPKNGVGPIGILDARVDPFKSQRG